METHKNTIERLEEEFSGTISAEDRQLLDEWTEETSANRRFHDAITRPQLTQQIDALGEEMRDSILTEVNRRIEAAAKRTLWLRIASVAASIALLLAGTHFLSYREGYRQVNSQEVRLSNPLGMQSSVVLSDGTRVVLNAGTTLMYPAAFVSGNREVEVCGEAFFEVAPDQKHPFIVTADHLKIRVVGTKFNVKAYREENAIEVTLTEGKVGVGLQKTSDWIYLSPRQQVSFDKSLHRFSRKEVDPQHYTAWKENKFYFNSQTFQEIATRLERRFNVRIDISPDRLKQVVFTGDFVRGENLEQILRVMTTDRRVGYTIDDDRVRIYEK